MAAGWLIPTSVWGWLPNGEEWLALCQQVQWEQNVQPLLAEPDEAIRQWLQEPIDDYGSTPLHVCAHEGNLGLLLQLLPRVRPEECLTLVTAVDKDGNTPLHRAACNGHLEVAQCLLAHGASTAVTNEHGSTLLHWAANYGNLELAQCLLAYGASAFAVNKYGNTPLHWAANYGHLEMAQCLLAHGASAFAVNQYGNTPLHWAADYDHLEVVQCLLAHGASATAVNNHGHTALHRAASCGHQNVVALLGNPPKPDFTPPSLQYLSCFAVWRSAGHIERLQQWLQASPLPPLQTVMLLTTLGFSRWFRPFRCNQESSATKHTESSTRASDFRLHQQTNQWLK